jgi:hypothetical protein
MDFNPDLKDMHKSHRSQHINMTPVKAGIRGNKVEGLQFRASFPIQDDITIGLESEFTDAADLLPGPIAKLQSFKSIFSAIGGVTSETFNIFKLQVWNETKPLQMTFKLIFSTKTDGWADVYMPAFSLASQGILKQIGTDKSTQYITPGISLANLSAVKRAQQDTKSSKDDKEKERKQAEATKNLEKGGLETGNLVAVHIPGLISFSDGFIPKANLVVSKETTRLGAPLWAEVEINVQTTLPAFDRMLTEAGHRYYRDGKTQIGLGKELASFVKNTFI